MGYLSLRKVGLLNIVFPVFRTFWFWFIVVEFVGMSAKPLHMVVEASNYLPVLSAGKPSHPKRQNRSGCGCSEHYAADKIAHMDLLFRNVATISRAAFAISDFDSSGRSLRSFFRSLYCRQHRVL